MRIFIKMKENIHETIEFPEGFEFKINRNEIIVSHKGKEIKKAFNLKNIDEKKEGNKLVLEAKMGSKRELKMIKTISAHVKNMIGGLQENYVYKLEIAYLHFPITIEIQKDKGRMLIKNFLGEKNPRIANIVPGAEVNIDRNKITIEANEKEIASQTAANIEIATKIKNRDRRKFQDGIFITEKAGRAI